VPPSTAANSAYPSPASNAEVESIRGAIKDLEEQLQEVTRRSEAPAHTDLEGITSKFAGGPFYSHREKNQEPNRPRGASRSVWHKTRLFGQSHWVNGIVDIQDIFELFEPFDREDVSTVYQRVLKCKNLARVIKSAQMPEWPTMASTDLPPKDVADQMVSNYLETYECLFRVIHVPTFKRDYDNFWGSSDATTDYTFMLLLKQVLAIGSATITGNQPWRTSAVGWMCEAQTWLSKPNFKSRLTLRYLQIHILSLFAREATGVGDDFVWTSCGTLYRMAMMSKCSVYVTPTLGCRRSMPHVQYKGSINEICTQNRRICGLPV
jgi:hypothetical protein